ncbi:hypothetical protein OG394_09570 [Kribbella sp. NBC_01245]|uniref:hypothetical protein n=1 Tax=Kribbella sp. NBC_01245 TaxID=2903578 RepID=UPI002E285E24|nr:hypothetical protein [Kribbella sp. NBC_01245]
MGDSLPEPTGLDFAGIWHSRYRYESSSRNEEHFCEHYVVFKQHGTRLIGENVPAVNDSILKLDLTVRGTTATGTWSERTSPTGYYRGREYHGAIQLVIDSTGKAMSGRWVGVDREFNVNSDSWELQWVDAASASSHRDYRLRA